MTPLMEGSQKRMGSEESDRVPKTTPRLNNLLRVLTELSTVVLTSMIYCSERMPKINLEGKRCKGRNPAQAFKGPLPVESHRMCLIPPATSCDNIYEIVPTGETHYSLDQLKSF